MRSRSGHNKVFRLVSGLTLGVLLLVSPGLLQAASLNDLLNQKRRLEQETKELKEEAGETRSDIRSLQSAVAFLDSSIDALSGDIRSTEQQIAETNTAIQVKEQELVQKKGEQDESIRIIYELEATNSMIESLLGNEDLSEATNRVEYIDALQARVAEMMTAIGEVKAGLETKRNELESLQAQLSEEKQQLEARQAQKARLLRSETTELSKINRQLDADRVKIANIEAQIAAQVAALWRQRGTIAGTGQRVAAGTPIGRLGSTGYSTGPHVHFECLRGGTPVNPRGCMPPLVWPLSNFSVSQEFGRPNWNAAYDWHTGIDLVAPYGTLVTAACSGEIIMHQWYGGYGNAVVIACDNGWWTLYGHMIN